MKNKVVVIGSYNTDLTIKTRRIPRPGETIIGGVFSQGGGGKGANQAVAAARAGADVAFIARVGNDALGREGIQKLNDEGIDTNFIYRDSSNPTGVAFIVVDEGGENSIVVASGANAKLNPGDIENAKSLILSAGVLLVQLESPIDAIKSAVKMARQNGTKVILNPAPAQPLDKNFLGLIDIITPNKVEAEMLTGIKVSGDESLSLIAERFFEFGIENVIITLGSRGIYAAFPGTAKVIPAYRVHSIDSTGAGDVFSGALAAFLAQGMPIEQAADMAGASASISVTRMGAQTGAPSRGEIESFIENCAAQNSELIKK